MAVLIRKSRQFLLAWNPLLIGITVGDRKRFPNEEKCRWSVKDRLHPSYGRGRRADWRGPARGKKAIATASRPGRSARYPACATFRQPILYAIPATGLVAGQSDASRNRWQQGARGRHFGNQPEDAVQSARKVSV